MSNLKDKKAKTIQLVKTSGDKAPFSLKKLERSLAKSGASKKLINHISETVVNELYQGITTKEIYNRAYAILNEKKPVFASRYKLQKAIYELGPTGYPFEKFVAAIMEYSGFETSTNLSVKGACVNHEVDIVAKKNNNNILIECKFHSEQGRFCNVKIPLYINSRFNDIKNANGFGNSFGEGWVVTNTRFTKDALLYGNCVGLYLLSWNYPNKDSLKARIDRLGLYPITVSTLLSKREKQFLLSRDVVLCRQLLGDKFFMNHLRISEERQQKIIDQMSELCSFSYQR